MVRVQPGQTALTKIPKPASSLDNVLVNPKIPARIVLDKIKLFSRCVQGATGVVGGSLILTESHPYLALASLAIGAIFNEILMFIKDKEMINPVNNTNE